MATIKSFTSLEQSKKLSEILPLESADMYWYLATKDKPKARFHEGYNEYGDFELPCWSLAALLNVLPKGYSLGNKKSNDKYNICMTFVEHDVMEYDNPVDVCYNMILKLHELNLL